MSASGAPASSDAPESSDSPDAGAEYGRRLDVVLFDGFQLLDVFGPLDLLGRFPERLSITLVGPHAGAVRSSQGAEIIATVGYAQAAPPDILFWSLAVAARVRW